MIPNCITLNNIMKLWKFKDLFIESELA